MIVRLWEQEQPRAVLVGWDTLEVPTYRHEAFEAYQSGREFDAALLEQCRVELASGLGGLERLVPVGRHLERVPADEHRARLFLLPQAHDHVREADDGVPVDRLRQRVIGAMRERIAVDCKKRFHRVSWSRSISRISLSVASCGSPPDSNGSPYATFQRASRESRSVPLIAAGTSGTPASWAMRAAPVCGRARHFFRTPFFCRVPSGNITTISP